MQLSAFFHAIDNHASHLGQLALWEFLHHRLHVGQTTVAVAVVEFAQSADEHKLIAVGAQGEARFRDVHIAPHLGKSVGFESQIGGPIERIFDLFAEHGVFFIEGIGKNLSPCAFRIAIEQSLQIDVGRGRVVFAHVEQIEMVIDIVHLFEIGEMVVQPNECFFAQGEVVELVFEDDARVVESFLNDEVAGRHLLFCEGNLCQVILPLVGVVLCAVFHLFERILHSFFVGNGIELFLRQLLLRLHAESGHHGLIGPLPVVDVFAFAPLFFKSLLTLLHGHGIIEIPWCVFLLTAHGGGHGVAVVVGQNITLGFVALLGALCFGLGLRVPFFFFFFLQCLNNPVYGCVAVFFTHQGERLQRVLQVNGIGIGNQFVEHFRPARKFFVVVAFLVEQSDGFAVAALGIGKLLHFPVKVAQLEQQHPFFYAGSGGFGHTFLVGTDSLCGVFLGQIDIADGIVYLVEIVFVVVRPGHALQLANHLFALSGSHHLCHGDAGIELHLVGRIQAHHMAVGLIRLGAMAECRFKLSEQIPLTCPLHSAHLVAYYFLQIGNGSGIVASVNIVIGIGIVPLFLCPPVHRIALHVANNVFCIVEPVFFDVTLGKPCPCPSVDGGLGFIESAHVREGRGCIVESSLMELRAPHQHPCLPQKGVIFAATEPLEVAFGFPARLVPLGPAFDGVQLNGFLTLLDGAVEVALAKFAALLVANGVEGNYFGEVVFVALFLFERTVDIGQGSIIIGVILGVEGMPEARLRRIFLRRASYCQQQQGGQHAGYNIFGSTQTHILI